MSKSEYDVSAIAWEVYELLYEDYFDNFIILRDGDRPYIKSKTVFGKKLSNEMMFSGETDLNFTKGFAHTRIAAYLTYLKESSAREDYIKGYINNLELCKKLTYSVVNISMMPITGNLQCTKGKLADDRIDTFIYSIENYYNGIDNLLMNYSSAQNANLLEEYLNLSKSASEYCLKMYRINESLVDDMIISGRDAINTAEKVSRYMKLAYRFWCQKLKYLNSKENISPIIRQELDVIADVLDRWF